MQIDRRHGGLNRESSDLERCAVVPRQAPAHEPGLRVRLVDVDSQFVIRIEPGFRGEHVDAGQIRIGVEADGERNLQQG